MQQKDFVIAKKCGVILQEKFPTFSPIAKTTPTGGVIHAYYSPQAEKAYALVATTTSLTEYEISRKDEIVKKVEYLDIRMYDNKFNWLEELAEQGVLLTKLQLDM
jgi:hypothetical protein